MRSVLIVVVVLILPGCSLQSQIASLRESVLSWELKAEAAELRAMGERAESQPSSSQCAALLATIKSAAGDCKIEQMAAEAKGGLCEAATATEPSNCPRCIVMLEKVQEFSKAKCEASKG